MPRRPHGDTWFFNLWESRALKRCRVTRRRGGVSQSMRQLLDAFFVHLGAGRTAPAGTLRAYRTDLNQLVTFLTAQGIDEPHALRADDMRAFCAWLHEHGYASATIARRIAALRAFGAFLTQAGILAADPCADLHPPAVTRAPRPALTLEQLDALRAVMVRNGAPDGWRDRALLEVLTATALRASALIALDTADIALEQATLTVRGRAGAVRTVGLSPAAVMALATYLQIGRPKLLHADAVEKALFLNHQGQRLTRQGCWVVLKSYARQIGLDGVTPELLRQSAAVHRFAGGASVDEVRTLMNHTVRKSTQVYRPKPASEI
jgi:integrase/recombinase XerD